MVLVLDHNKLEDALQYLVIIEQEYVLGELLFLKGKGHTEQTVEAKFVQFIRVVTLQ